MPLILSGSSGLSGNVGNVTKDMLPAGSVLQVLQYVYSSADTVQTNDNHVDLPGILGNGSIVITPQNTTSKILITTYLHQGHEDTWRSHNFRLSRKVGSGTYNDIANYAYNDWSSGHSNGGGGTTHVWLDSPGTTQQVAYKYAARRGHASSNVLRFNVNTYSGTYVNEAFSTITLMEIKA